MRVIGASTGGAGHFTPLLPVLGALAGRGDEVLVVGPPGLEEPARRNGYRFWMGADPPAEKSAPLFERLSSASAHQTAGLLDREFFGRLCTATMLPAVDAAFSAWQPQLVVREPCEYASAIVAGRRGVPQAQVAISMAEIEAAVLPMVAPVLTRYEEHIDERLLAAPYLTCFPASLDPSPFPATHRFRHSASVSAGDRTGAATAIRPLPGWWAQTLTEAPLVVVTFGSLAGCLRTGVAAFQGALEAVDGLPVRVLLTVGNGVPIPELGPIPENVHVEHWVPQIRALRDASLVVCHGGSGTTFGALAAGLPLVIVPMFADQPINARRVRAAGAALIVEPICSAPGGAQPFGPADAPRLRAAIQATLAEPAYQRAASVLAGEMEHMPRIEDVIGGLYVW